MADSNNQSDNLESSSLATYLRFCLNKLSLSKNCHFQSGFKSFGECWLLERPIFLILLSLCTLTHTLTFTLTRMHSFTPLHLYMQALSRTHMHAHFHTHMHAHFHTHMHARSLSSFTQMSRSIISFCVIFEFFSLLIAFMEKSLLHLHASH